MADPLPFATAVPASVGLDAERLESAWSALAERGTQTFLVARRGCLVFERYAGDFAAGKPHYSASLAKALVGGLSLALAMDDGLIAPEDRACQYIPQWLDHPLKARISVRHLATHSSGVEDAELSDAERDSARREGRSISEDHMELPGWKGAFWRREPDPFTLSRDEAPILFEPGSACHYSNPGMAMLAYCVTAALRGSEHPDIRTLLRRRLFEPLGLRRQDWSIGYGQTCEVDGLPLVANWGGGSFTARAAARIGQLLLQDGAWEGRQLLSPVVARRIALFAGTPAPEDERAAGNPAPLWGLGWWTNADRVWTKLPADAFGGAGAGHQILLVVPSLELVVVRNGSSMGTPFWRAAVEALFHPIVDTLSLRPPYPSSPAITAVDWDPPSQVRRLSLGGRHRDGSDNWPLTWADDGLLYTAYGDGYGFEPGVPEKLSLGYGVVTGGPDNFAGLNIRSESERRGPGPRGEKASSLLSVGGTLYIWVRNLDGQGGASRLGWSTDHARTWSWAGWTFCELGHPAFINYGRDYAGARDRYVYTVSHDDPSAYKTAGHFVLMRVPQGALRQRSQYEFFVELNERGEPVWSKRIVDRGPVFTHANQCRRSSISYNLGLGRYLWWQQLSSDEDADTRFEGGFGLYDAPEPWGPWTTLYFTERWDLGPGELGHFPTPWMDAEGRSAWLVFSGSDHFCARRAVFTLGER